MGKACIKMSYYYYYFLNFQKAEYMYILVRSRILFKLLLSYWSLISFKFYIESTTQHEGFPVSNHTTVRTSENSCCSLFTKVLLYPPWWKWSFDCKINQRKLIPFYGTLLNDWAKHSQFMRNSLASKNGMIHTWLGWLRIWDLSIYMHMEEGPWASISKQTQTQKTGLLTYSNFMHTF